MAVLGLHCCEGFSLAAAGRGYPLVAVLGLLTAVTSFVEHRLGPVGFMQALVVMHGFSCFSACEIFSDQGS